MEYMETMTIEEAKKRVPAYKYWELYDEQKVFLTSSEEAAKESLDFKDILQKYIALDAFNWLQIRLAKTAADKSNHTYKVIVLNEKLAIPTNNQFLGGFGNQNANNTNKNSFEEMQTLFNIQIQNMQTQFKAEREQDRLQNEFDRKSQLLQSEYDRLKLLLEMERKDFEREKKAFREEKEKFEEKKEELLDLIDEYEEKEKDFTGVLKGGFTTIAGMLLERYGEGTTLAGGKNQEETEEPAPKVNVKTKTFEVQEEEEEAEETED